MLVVPIQIPNFLVDFRNIKSHAFNTLFIGVHLFIHIVISILPLYLQHSNQGIAVVYEN